MAERVGFEPTVRSRVHLISSQARSATPAPLHFLRNCLLSKEARQQAGKSKLRGLRCLWRHGVWPGALPQRLVLRDWSHRSATRRSSLSRPFGQPSIDVKLQRLMITETMGEAERQATPATRCPGSRRWTAHSRDAADVLVAGLISPGMKLGAVEAIKRRLLES